MPKNPKTGASRLAEGVERFWGKYKSLCISIFERVPYAPAHEWILYLKGDIPGALKGGRGLFDNIRDSYALAFISAFTLIIISFPIIAIISQFFLSLASTLLIALLAGAPAFQVDFVAIMVLLALGVAGAIIAIPLINLLMAALLHIIAKVLGGKADFRSTFSVLILSLASVLMLSLPMAFIVVLSAYMLGLLNCIPYFYGIYALYRGIMWAHGLTPMRTVAALVIYFVLANLPLVLVNLALIVMP